MASRAEIANADYNQNTMQWGGNVGGGVVGGLVGGLGVV